MQRLSEMKKIVLTPDDIKEIAEQLSFNFRAFIHKETQHLLFVPDPDHFMDLEGWEEELERLDETIDEYHQIEKWHSSDAFKIMQDFAGQVSNRRVQNELFMALEKKKPFREFKFVVDNAGDYREEWFAFRDARQQDYVAKKIEELNEEEEEGEE